MIIDSKLQEDLKKREEGDKKVVAAVQRLLPSQKLIQKPKHGRCPYDKSRLESFPPALAGHDGSIYYHYQKCPKCSYEYGYTEHMFASSL